MCKKFSFKSNVKSRTATYNLYAFARVLAVLKKEHSC